jgi:hypothetical protein
MPATKVVFFRNEDKVAPAYEGIKQLYREGHKRPAAKLVGRIVRLQEMGYELRRPEADTLRDGIHELRAAFGHVQYRILYALHGRGIAMLSHLITKEGEVPDAEIDRALANYEKFAANPDKHTFVTSIPF